ncbi:MAG: hypothetical protein C5B52_07840 [Bacteroidetes bacterium]|nr:MAG: hypothetical protein C5B52_07840 [Bacteroidota bacterium]
MLKTFYDFLLIPTSVVLTIGVIIISIKENNKAFRELVESEKRKAERDRLVAKAELMEKKSTN